MTTSPARESVSLRPAERADLLDVYRIEKASFPQPWPFVAFEGYLGEPGFIVAVDRDTPVGYVVADVVESYTGALGHVKDLAVHPTRRGDGIGHRLLCSGLSVLEHRGVKRVRLEVRESNEAAMALYRGVGFEVGGVIPGYYDDGEDALVMVRLRDGPVSRG